MEIEEFKSEWNTQLGVIIKNKTRTAQLNNTSMNVSSALNNLNNTNVYWWKFTKNVMILLFLMLAVNIALFLFMPEKFQHVQNALPVFAFFTVFGLAALWLYYEQVKIFDITESPNIQSALAKAIKRFKRWYTLSTLVYIAILPGVFYMIALVFFQTFRTVMEIRTGIIIGIALTLLTLVLNHLYYKKTYFKWIQSLNESLRELEGS